MEKIGMLCENCGSHNLVQDRKGKFKCMDCGTVQSYTSEESNIGSDSPTCEN